MDPSKKPKKSALKGGGGRADDSAEGSFQAGKGVLNVQEQLQANFEIKVRAATVEPVGWCGQTYKCLRMHCTSMAVLSKSGVAWGCSE
jgi:hypothetical protein